MFDLIIFAGKDRAEILEHPILGVPLIERVVRRLAKCGAERIVLVGDMDGAQLRNLSSVSAISGELSLSRGLPDFRLVPPKSDAVLFWDANVITDQRLAESLVSQATEQDICVVAHPPRHANAALEAPVALAIPTKLLPQLDDLRNISDVAHLVENLQSENTNVQSMKFPENGFAIRVKNSDATARLETELLNELRKPMEVDGFLGALVYRIFSLPISRRIAPFPITPNHVTAVALILGLSAAGAMASGTPLGFLLGVVLLQLGAIIDCVDGEIARLKYQGSLDGAWFDTVSDDIVNNSFILGAGIGLARYHDAAWPLVLAILAVMVIVPGLNYLYRALLLQGSGDLCDFQWTSERRIEGPQTGLMARVGAVVKYLVKRDVYVTLFLVSVLLGIPEFIPVAGLAGALGFAISVAREAQYRRLQEENEPAEHEALEILGSKNCL